MVMQTRLWLKHYWWELVLLLQPLLLRQFLLYQ